MGNDTLSDGVFLHLRANCRHLARSVTDRNERKAVHGIVAGRDGDIDEVEARGPHPHQHLSDARKRIGPGYAAERVERGCRQFYGVQGGLRVDRSAAYPDTDP
jgi:hypothetical protein